MANEGIKREAKRRGVHLWQIADKLCMADSALSRRLRYELSEEERLKIFGIINEIAGGERIAENKADRKIQPEAAADRLASCRDP